MRIGIDAKWYFSGPPSGVNVVRNIVNYFIEDNNHDEIVLFLAKKDYQLIDFLKCKFLNNSRVSYILVPSRINFLTNLLLFPYYFYNRQIDIILFQNYIPLVKSRRTKYVNYVHDFLFLDYPQYFSKIERFIYKFMVWSARNADHVITISQSERRRILTHANIDINKTSFVYHGLDSIFYERSDDVKLKIRSKYNLPEKFILFVGRINIRKNIICLLEAYSALDLENIFLVIVGKEEKNGPILEKESERLMIKDKVTIVGYLPDNDLAEIVSASSLFVFPSFAEGFGLPPLEAMKSGVPTIVSESTSLPEVCGNAAILFDPNNHVDLATKMKLILTNPNIYESYKVNGLIKSEEYSWPKSVCEILSILKKVSRERKNS